MTYNIKPTSTKQRKHAGSDYIIVMNKNVKLNEKIGNYCVVKFLFKNCKTDYVEYRTMNIFGKVVVDNNLGVNEVAVDQTIRNALGIPVGALENIKVKIAPIKNSFWQRVFDSFHYGNYFFARVNKPDVVDIEKGFCRMSGDSIRVMGAMEGKTIIIEKPTSNMKINTNNIIEKMTYGNNSVDLSIIKKYYPQIENIDIPRDLQNILSQILPNKKINNTYEAVEILLQLEKCDEKLRKIFINNIFELWDWEVMSEHKKMSLKIPVYTLQEESKSRINFIKENENEISFYTRYPNAEKIFEVNPDINEIYLDKYYRDLLNCDLLDSVKVKKNRVAIILNEIMEYGIMFVLTVVATIIAFNGENLRYSLIALAISVLITVFMIKIRTK